MESLADFSDGPGFSIVLFETEEQARDTATTGARPRRSQPAVAIFAWSQPRAVFAAVPWGRGFSPVSSAELDPNGPRARGSAPALDARNAAVAAVRSGRLDLKSSYIDQREKVVILFLLRARGSAQASRPGLSATATENENETIERKQCMEIAGKVVLITGASSGIGRASARLFARRGARLALAARSAEKLAQLASELPDALAVPTDLRDEAAVRQMVTQTQEHYQRIDVLINNAAQGQFAPIEKINLEIYRTIFEVNVVSVIAAMQEVIPIMRAQGGGVIINISSGVSKIRTGVLLLDMVDNSINLCEDTSGRFFCQWTVQTGHLFQKRGSHSVLLLALSPTSSPDDPSTQLASSAFKRKSAPMDMRAPREPSIVCCSAGGHGWSPLPKALHRPFATSLLCSHAQCLVRTHKMVIGPPPLQVGKQVWRLLRCRPGAPCERCYPMAHRQIDPLNESRIQPPREA